MEEVKDFRIMAHAIDKPFTLSICTQGPTEFAPKDISKIYLYNIDFYNKVRKAIIEKIFDVHNNGTSRELETMEYKIKPGEKLVVNISNSRYIQRNNPNFDTDVMVNAFHEYNGGSEILLNVNIKSLYKCGRSISEITSKLRASSNPDVWFDEDDEDEDIQPNVTDDIYKRALSNMSGL